MTGWDADERASRAVWSAATLKGVNGSFLSVHAWLREWQGQAVRLGLIGDMNRSEEQSITLRMDGVTGE